MSIGIIGAGALGSNVARVLASKGIAATISNRRGPESLQHLVAELGPSIKSGTPLEAARADIVVVAVRWTGLQEALSGLPDWKGRIVIDATNAVEFLDPDAPKDPSNPLAAYGIKAVDLQGKVSSEVFGTFVPGARVVKAFNHLDANVLPQSAPSGGQRVLFYSGDDQAAKHDVRELVERMGFFPIDLGELKVGGVLAAPPFGALAMTNFVKV